MPPHCDSMDGPVVMAARRAIDARDVRLVLPYVKEDGEPEVCAAFGRTMAARNGGAAASELADLYFFETVVRVHRAGEGAPYTGLKPAGLPVGPVIPIAERAIEVGQADELVAFLGGRLRDEIHLRFDELMERKLHADESIVAARRFVDASLGLQVWAHELYGSIRKRPHGDTAGEHGHPGAVAAEPGHGHGHG